MTDELDKSKNSKQLTSFVEYCLLHPDERFWQAICNWSGFAYLFGSQEVLPTIIGPSNNVGRKKFIEQLEDLFFKEL